jgi:hypothetical protein
MIPPATFCGVRRSPFGVGSRRNPARYLFSAMPLVALETSLLAHVNPLGADKRYQSVDGYVHSRIGGACSRHDNVERAQR